MRLSYTLSMFQDRPCPYCTRLMDLERDSLMPTRDHYPIPKSRGGRRTIICCYTCNNMKGDMSAHDWAAFMAENKGGWFSHRGQKTGLPIAPADEPKRASSQPAKPIPYSETRMILTHGKKAWKDYKVTGIKPAPLVCPVMTMVAQFFMELRYPSAYRMPAPPLT